MHECLHEGCLRHEVVKFERLLGNALGFEPLARHQACPCRVASLWKRTALRRLAQVDHGKRALTERCEFNEVCRRVQVLLRVPERRDLVDARAGARRIKLNISRGVGHDSRRKAHRQVPRGPARAIRFGVDDVRKLGEHAVLIAHARQAALHARRVPRHAVVFCVAPRADRVEMLRQFPGARPRCSSLHVPPGGIHLVSCVVSAASVLSSYNRPIAFTILIVTQCCICIFSSFAASTKCE